MMLKERSIFFELFIASCDALVISVVKLAVSAVREIEIFPILMLKAVSYSL
jgi:hypothetical protein